MMLVQKFVAFGMLLSTASAAPQPTQASVEANWTTTTTLSATLTFDLTTTIVSTIQPTTTTTTSYYPTYTGTEVYAYRPDSPIHLLPFNAAGLIFRLGGQTVTYCPPFIEQEYGCPPGDVTAFNNCSLSAVVPGGQATYLAPDGQLKFTQAHSQRLEPPDSIICPLTFNKCHNDSDATEVSISGFGANGFMACPMLNSTRPEVKEQWQIYAKISNASVPLKPLQANSSSCLDFEAIGINKNLGHSYAAWEYI